MFFDKAYDLLMGLEKDELITLFNMFHTILHAGQRSSMILSATHFVGMTQTILRVKYEYDTVRGSGIPDFDAEVQRLSDPDQPGDS